MADGDGGIAVVLLHHELCHGFANDVAAAKDDALLAGGLDVVALEELKDALGGGGDEAGQSDGHAADVDGVESVDVLAEVDGLDYLLLVDVARQRKLHDKSVDISVLVEFVNLVEQLLLGDVVLKAEQGGGEAAFLAGEHLVGYVFSLPPSWPTSMAARWGRLPPRATMSDTCWAISALMVAAVCFPSISCMGRIWYLKFEIYCQVRMWTRAAELRGTVVVG